jgi:hypothetical protein
MGISFGIDPIWASQTDEGRTHIATKGIVQSGLVLNLDAGVSSSYPGSGTTWTDLSGNGNNGTLVSGVGYSGNNGGSLSFDGVNDYINYGTSGYSDIRTLTTTTLNFFCYCTGFSNPSSGGYSWAPLISIDKYQNGNSWRKMVFWFGNNSESQFINCDFFDGLGTGKTVSKNMTVLNKFLYVTSTVDANYTRLYVNGALENETSGMVVNANPQSSEFTIGSRIGSDYDGYFKGNIFQASIYNRALTEQEIQQNFNAYRRRFGI